MNGILENFLFSFKIQRLNHTIAELERKLQKKDEMTTELNRTIAKFEGRLQEKDQILTELRGENGQLHNSVGELNNKLVST